MFEELPRIKEALGDWFTNKSQEEARRVVEQLSLISGLATLELYGQGSNWTVPYWINPFQRAVHILPPPLVTSLIGAAAEFEFANDLTEYYDAINNAEEQNKIQKFLVVEVKRGRHACTAPLTQAKARIRMVIYHFGFYQAYSYCFSLALSGPMERTTWFDLTRQIDGFDHITGVRVEERQLVDNRHEMVALKPYGRSDECRVVAEVSRMLLSDYTEGYMLMELMRDHPLQAFYHDNLYYPRRNCFMEPAIVANIPSLMVLRDLRSIMYRETKPRGTRRLTRATHHQLEIYAWTLDKLKTYLDCPTLEAKAAYLTGLLRNVQEKYAGQEIDAHNYPPGILALMVSNDQGRVRLDAAIDFIMKYCEEFNDEEQGNERRPGRWNRHRQDALSLTRDRAREQWEARQHELLHAALFEIATSEFVNIPQQPAAGWQ